MEIADICQHGAGRTYRCGNVLGSGNACPEGYSQIKSQRWVQLASTPPEAPQDQLRQPTLAIGGVYKQALAHSFAVRSGPIDDDVWL